MAVSDSGEDAFLHPCYVPNQKGKAGSASARQSASVLVAVSGAMTVPDPCVTIGDEGVEFGLLEGGEEPEEESADVDDLWPSWDQARLHAATREAHLGSIHSIDDLHRLRTGLGLSFRGAWQPVGLFAVLSSGRRPATGERAARQPLDSRSTATRQPLGTGGAPALLAGETGRSPTIPSVLHRARCP